MGIGAAVVLVALVIAANIWPRGSTVAAPSAAPTPRPAAVAGGSISDLIRHSWQRPIPVTPGMDRWGSGFLIVASSVLDYGREPGPTASRSAVTVADVDALEVTATVETRECAIGDVGTYRWSVEGKDTVMILSAISPDACAARERALAGTWVRSDLPVAVVGEAALTPGTHLTSAFDPFGRSGTPGQLSFTVPEGWMAVEDRPEDVVLMHQVSDAAAGQPSTDLLIVLFAQPWFTAVQNGAPCGASSDAPRVRQGADDIASAIMALDGVVSVPPTAVTIGGYRGQILDLRLAPSWIGGCRTPDGHIAAVPFLLGVGPQIGPTVGVLPEQPLRLILLDLTAGRTVAVAMFRIGPATPSSFEEDVAAAMPIIESLQFPAAPAASPS